jgi:hypothetical protein
MFVEKVNYNLNKVSNLVIFDEVNNQNKGFAVDLICFLLIYLNIFH